MSSLRHASAQAVQVWKHVKASSMAVASRPLSRFIVPG